MNRTEGQSQGSRTGTNVYKSEAQRLQEEADHFTK